MVHSDPFPVKERNYSHFPQWALGLVGLPELSGYTIKPARNMSAEALAPARQTGMPAEVALLPRAQCQQLGADYSYRSHREVIPYTCCLSAAYRWGESEREVKGSSFSGLAALCPSPGEDWAPRWWPGRNQAAVVGQSLWVRWLVARTFLRRLRALSWYASVLALKYVVIHRQPRAKSRLAQRPSEQCSTTVISGLLCHSMATWRSAGLRSNNVLCARAWDKEI